MNKVSIIGETPIFEACRSGDEALVRCLTEHETNVNKKNDDGETVVFEATRLRYESIVKYIKEHSANENKE